MKVFVSWSGEKSRDIARVLGEWLPSVLHAVEPFVSSTDIRAGTRWQAEIAKELDDTDFGLICVTKENQSAEWLNFEAGALAKSVSSSRVVPLAVDLSPADITNPLGQFQAMRPTKEDIADVLASMNEACASPISDSHLRKTIDKWWPDLEDELTKIEGHDYSTESGVSSPGRTDRELLEEVLDSVRGLGRAPMVARPGESDNEKTRIALEEIEKVLFDPDHNITAWSTQINGDVITIEIHPTPTVQLRREAMAIGLEHGVDIRLGSFSRGKSSERSE